MASLNVPEIVDPVLPWGERLRIWRVEVKAWSQQELADHIVHVAFQTKEDRGTRFDVRLVGRWESGAVQRPQGIYRRLLTQLGAPLPSATTESERPCRDVAPEGCRVVRTRGHLALLSTANTTGEVA